MVADFRERLNIGLHEVLGRVHPGVEEEGRPLDSPVDLGSVLVVEPDVVPEDLLDGEGVETLT